MRMASTAFTTRLRMTCCSWTALPFTSGRFSSSWVSTRTCAACRSTCTIASTVRDEVVEVYGGFRRLRVLAEQRVHTPDDVGGVLAGPDNFTERTAHLLDIRPFPREPALSGAGLQHHSGDRLSDLMRDGSGQLTRSRDAVHPGQLGDGLARSDLRKGAPPMLIGQPGDQRALQQDDGERAEDLEPVFFPQAGLVGPDDAAGRQQQLR